MFQISGLGGKEFCNIRHFPHWIFSLRNLNTGQPPSKYCLWQSLTSPFYYLAGIVINDVISVAEMDPRNSQEMTEISRQTSYTVLYLYIMVSLSLFLSVPHDVKNLRNLVPLVEWIAQILVQLLRIFIHNNQDSH